MSLTNEDLEKIRTLMQSEMQSEVQGNNKRLIAMMFEHFVTKQELPTVIESIVDRKLNPIIERLSSLEDSNAEILSRLDRDQLPFIEKFIDEVATKTENNTVRIVRLENKVLGK